MGYVLNRLMSLCSWRCQKICRLSLAFIIDWRVVSIFTRLCWSPTVDLCWKNLFQIKPLRLGGFPEDQGRIWSSKDGGCGRGRVFVYSCGGQESPDRLGLLNRYGLTNSIIFCQFSAIEDQFTILFLWKHKIKICINYLNGRDMEPARPGSDGTSCNFDPLW